MLLLELVPGLNPPVRGGLIIPGLSGVLPFAYVVFLLF